MCDFTCETLRPECQGEHNQVAINSPVGSFMFFPWFSSWTSWTRTLVCFSTPDWPRARNPCHHPAWVEQISVCPVLVSEKGQKDIWRKIDQVMGGRQECAGGGENVPWNRGFHFPSALVRAKWNVFFSDSSGARIWISSSSDSFPCRHGNTVAREIQFLGSREVTTLFAHKSQFTAWFSCVSFREPAAKFAPQVPFVLVFFLTGCRVHTRNKDLPSQRTLLQPIKDPNWITCPNGNLLSDKRTNWKRNPISSPFLIRLI